MDLDFNLRPFEVVFLSCMSSPSGEQACIIFWGYLAGPMHTTHFFITHYQRSRQRGAVPLYMSVYSAFPSKPTLPTAIRLEVRASPRTLDDLRDLLLQVVPVMRIHLCHLRAEIALDRHQRLPVLARAHKRDRHADAAKAPRAPDAVQIGLRIGFEADGSGAGFDGAVGHVVVDDHGDGFDVNAAGEDVGRDQDFGGAFAELVDDDVAFLAFVFACEGDDAMAFIAHAPFNFFGGSFGLGWRSVNGV